MHHLTIGTVRIWCAGNNARVDTLQADGTWAIMHGVTGAIINIRHDQTTAILTVIGAQILAHLPPDHVTKEPPASEPEGEIP